MSDTHIAASAAGSIWYRVWQSHHEWERLYFETYRVVRQTPKGVWLEPDVCGKPVFARLKARKRVAHPTKDEAIASFIARKRKQIKILTAQINKAEEGLVAAIEVQSGADPMPEVL